MGKWLGKEGLKAVFKDTATMPWNMTRGFYKMPQFKDRFMDATAGVIFSHATSATAASFMGVVTGMGLLAAVPTYCLFPCLLLAGMYRKDPGAKKELFPNIYAHAARHAENRAEPPAPSHPQ